ncbi:flavin reductase family protein [Streptomyces sp. NPDC001508]|uniref:flavin reductase family protein n=1 Tax=Streptomyces sp. NPDC001508 TaxID=3154656 RepID=UPI00333084C9
MTVEPDGADDLGLAPPGDPWGMRAAYARVPQGVSAVCGLSADGCPVGMAASSLTTVSLEPPLVSVCVANTSATWPRLRALPTLGVSVLAASQQEVCRTLGARDGDRFAGVPWQATGRGAVLVRGAALWLECSPREELPAGDHRIVLLRVESLGSRAGREPLVFHGGGFRRLATAS